jgi:hypothetical protein
MVLLGARRPKIGGPEMGARVQQKCSRELCYLTGFLCVVHVWCSRESCTFPIHGCSVWLPDLTDRLKPVGRRSSVMSLLKFRIQKIGKYRGVENRGPYPLRKNQKSFERIPSSAGIVQGIRCSTTPRQVDGEGPSPPRQRGNFTLRCSRPSQHTSCCPG